MKYNGFDYELYFGKRSLARVLEDGSVCIDLIAKLEGSVDDMENVGMIQISSRGVEILKQGGKLKAITVNQFRKSIKNSL
jgi:hypothetical protein